MTELITRFAPSPTGSLHVGGARTALYCRLLARAQSGRFVLRIEDTDRKRSTEAAAAGILRDLRWLGLTWDDGPDTPDPRGAGPYFQSQRRDRYAAVFEQLLEAGHAYEAWESSEELMAMRKAAEAAKTNFRYRRQTYTDAQLASYRAEGRIPVLRFKAPDHALTVNDLVLGEVTLQPEELDDIVIRKADGWPTYHFAVVVDDHDMGVTLVLRGQEHLLNTHKHLGMYEALGWTPPEHAHLPLIFNPTGSKMSKRDKAKAARAAAREAKKNGGHADWAFLAEPLGVTADLLQRFAKKKTDDLALANAIADHLGVELPLIEVQDYRMAGYLPEALVNYLALLGWSPGDDREIMSEAELIESFSLEQVGKTAARFDPVKLAWLNAETLRAASASRQHEALQDWCSLHPDHPLSSASEALTQKLLTLYIPRAQTLQDLATQTAWVFAAPTTYNAKAVKKVKLKAAGRDNLLAVRAVIASAPWTEAGLEEAITAFAETTGQRLGGYAQPLRVALTGNSVSPGLYETLTLLDRDEVLTRIDACATAMLA